jgi:hypothetical protein
MNVFDDLLHEVLREDGNQQAPPGMKKRILAALPHKSNHFPGQRAMWAGIAAAMLVGVFGIVTRLLLHTNGGLIVASDPDQRSVVRFANPNALGEAGRSHLPPSEKPAVRKAILHGSIRNRLAPPQRPIQIAPVVLEPLVIKPIEIASMTPNGSNMKGKSQ